MPSLFNFYEGVIPSGTGAYDKNQIIDFFTGVYFPASLALGKTIGFTWDGMGIREANTTLDISGASTNSNKDETYNQISFFGRVSPLIKDSGSINLGFSGALPMTNQDSSYFLLSYKGTGTSDNKDSPSFLVSVTGFITSGRSDISDFSLSNTGFIVACSGIPSNLTLNIRGSLNGQRNSDRGSISLNMSNIVYSTDSTTIVTESSEEYTSISFNISNIYYD